METVSNITSAASRAIWGDQPQKDESASKEPASGEVGNVKAGEPYDKGNLEAGVPNASNTTTSEHKTLAETTSKELSPSALSSATPYAASVPSSAIPSSATEQPQNQQAVDRPTEEPSSLGVVPIVEDKKDAPEATKSETIVPDPKPLEDKTSNIGTADKGDSGVNNLDAVKAANPTAEKKSESLKAPALTQTPEKKTGRVSDSPSSASGQKQSLKDKIKAKLHRDKH